MPLPTPSSLAVTSRDIQILEFVYSFDRCSREHVLRRFWAKNGALGPGPESACHRRIAKLITAGFLTADRLPSLTGVGSGKSLLGIGPRGRLLLSELLGLSRSELNRLRQLQSPFAAAHHLAICDVRLCLILASEQLGQVELTEWVSERELRTPPITRVRDPKAVRVGEKPPLIPLVADGAFTLSLASGQSQSWLLELDMGTIPQKRIRAKLRAYLVNYRKDPRPILWVVNDQKRKAEILSWSLAEAEALEGTDPTIFLVTTRAQISEHSILTAPIWQVAGGPEGLCLIPQTAVKQASPSSLAASGQLIFGKGSAL